MILPILILCIALNCSHIRPKAVWFANALAHLCCYQLPPHCKGSACTMSTHLLKCVDVCGKSAAAMVCLLAERLVSVM